MSKNTKTITDEVLKSLKALDDLSQNSLKNDSKKKKPIIGSKDLKDLIKASDTLKNDIEFFGQAKEMGMEAEQKIKSGEINNKEKESIVKFINNCYEDGANVKNGYLELDNEKLLKTLKDFNRDINRYIQELNKKLEETEKRIASEKDAHDEVRKDILKGDLEEEDEALEDINLSANKFDQEIEKLDFLEDELNLVIMEQDNQSQINNVRNLINKR